MNHPLIFVSFGIICLIAVAFAGCAGNPGNIPVTGPTTLSGTPIKVGHLVVNEEQNTATVLVAQNSTITVKLKENPTTGFQWNLTTTEGLNIGNDSYVASDPSGKLVGAGGTRAWEISATAKGTQNIIAVYKRSWEPVLGNETSFSVTVIVE